MENFETQAQIIPLTRKKLLAKALYMDSPLGYSSRSGFNKTVACAKAKCLNTAKPLEEKDLNKTLCTESLKSERTGRKVLMKTSDEGIVSKVRHCRSSSRGVIRKVLQETDKKTMFLFESRYNRRMADLFLEKITLKMKADPEYLGEIREKDVGKYVAFKEKHIEIHESEWVQACISEVQNDSKEAEVSSEMAETKKSAFLAFISNPNMLKPILNKAKSQVFRLCKY